MAKNRLTLKPLLIGLGALIVSLIPIGIADWAFGNTYSASITNANAVYIKDGSNKRYFPTIEAAVQAANRDGASNNIYVVPGTTDGTTANPTVNYIKQNITISQGDSLYLPYNSSEDYSIGQDYEHISNNAGGVNYAREFAYRENYCVSTVYVDPNVTITINGGNLYVGGITGNTGQQNIGKTIENFAEIILSEGAQIIANKSGNQNPKIECYGYIRRSEESHNNGDFSSAKLIMNAGELHVPTVIYDFKGGTITSSLTGSKIFPFSIFDFPNIEVETEIKYPSSLISYLKLEVSYGLGSMFLNEQMKFIGPSSDFLFLLGENSSLKLTYIPQTWAKPTIKYSEDTSYTKLEAYGNITVNSVSVKVAILSIKSSEYFLPISYKFKIYIRSGCEITSSYAIKLLPGTVFVIDPGANATVNGDLFIEEAVTGYQNQVFSYPFGSITEDAKFVVNGNVRVGNYGNIYGFVDTTAEQSNISFDSEVATTSLKEFHYDDGNNYQYVNFNNYSRSGNIYSTLDGETKLSNFSAARYISALIKGAYCWTLDTSNTAIGSVTLSSNPTQVSYEGGSIALTATVSGIEEKGSRITLEWYCNNALIHSENLEDDNTDGVIASQYTYTIVASDAALYEDVQYSFSVKATHRNNPNISKTATEVVTQKSKYSISNISITLTENSVSKDGGTVTITYSYNRTPSNEPVTVTLYITVGNSTKSVVNFTSGRSYELSPVTENTNTVFKIGIKFTNVSGYSEQYSTTKTVTQTYSSGGGGGLCVLGETEILLANGDVKLAQDIRSGDMLQVFNHETGQMDVSPVLFNDIESIDWFDITYLKFSNGEEVGICGEHGFFNKTLNKYVYITKDNASEFIGHTFYTIDGDVILEEQETKSEFVPVYSPVTAYHLNYFTNGLLSMPGGITGLFNMFEYEPDTLKYNEEAKQKDIEKYGLFAYEDFKDYCSYEFYSAFPAPYLKVSIGKGLVTFDRIKYYIERYSKLC